MGIRSAIREDTGFSPADLVYGTPLWLPGEFVDVPLADAPSPTSVFVAQLRQVLADQCPAQAVHHRRPGDPTPNLPASLMLASHVYVRIDAVKRPLTPPYEGPYPVQQHGPKTFVLLKNSKPWTVSVDRLKVAIVPPVSVAGPSLPGPGVAARPPPSLSAVPASVPVVRPTSNPVNDVRPAPALPSYATVLRSGRVSVPPRRL